MHVLKYGWLAIAALLFVVTGGPDVRAQDRMVINEIHYNPDVKTEPAEFVELYNPGAAAVNLAGWYFSDGLAYTFPATNVPPGGYAVVAQNPAFLQTKFGASGALGPFNPDGSSGLSKFGEAITLRNAAGEKVDEVSYKLGFPWPTVGDATVVGNGSSIELIHPSFDNDLGGNWRAAGGGSGTPAQNVTLLAGGSTWRYVKGTSEATTPTTLWRQPAFNDATWATGALPIGYGENFIATTLGDMQNGYVSVFLRKQFVVTDPGQFTRLVIEAQYDDGFKAWINGVLVIDGNANMPSGEVAYNISAVSALENLNYVTFNLAPASLLVSGTNTIAIQAANSSLGASSDFFFDARVIGQIGGTSGTGPTPGRVNTVYATNAPPAIRQVEHQPEQPVSGQPVRISAKVTDPDGVGSVTLQYQVVLPGQYIDLADAAYTNAANWITLSMRDDGTGGDLTAGDDVFTAEIPAGVQAHRRLIRYRLTVADAGGRSVSVPYADDLQPNFAYFVYDGVPAWRGAVQPGGAGSNGVVFTVSSNEMARLPGLYLIGKSNTIAQATWFSRYGGDLYQWGGTLVYDGKVYDHIRYRARGGVWRYSMVKNMWKFDLNRGHDFEARDNWGRKYKVPWRKINLGACIQQGDFWHRGEQGMFESVGSRLFELAGVESFKTAFLTMRVIDDALEADPATQYEGDFWGLYLLVEQEDGRFVEEHNLPDSNFYKMEGGTGELNNLGPNGPTDKSDLNFILNNYTGKPETWWRTNWNLPKYYSYQAIAQGIHHYDICYDKNFFYYFDPRTRLWEITSWDLDLTWANNMFDAGCGGKDRVYQRIFDEATPAKPNIAIEYKNRVREVRDLLFNTNETFRLIDEYAWLLRGLPGTNRTILDADRGQWDYNPKMINSAYTPNVNKASQGYFYQFTQESGTNAALKGSFNANLEIMRHYVRIRGAFLDGIAADAAIPARPTITYTGPTNYPINRLTFRCSNYSGANPFASMRWRVGEITDTNHPSYRPDEPWKYEIEPVWDSGPISPFTPDVTLPANVLREGSRYRVRVQFADNTGRKSQWSLPHEFTCGGPENLADLLNFLRITEVMYNPPPEGFEYVELHNASASVTLDLAGVKFTQGIDFAFGPGTTLPPGGYLLVIGTTNVAAFRAYYGLADNVPIAAAFDGSLNNGGEQLTLRTSAGGTDIVSFNYGDGRGWPLAADGPGHSLVLLDSAESIQGAGAAEYPGNWRASTRLRGSPGRADTPLPPTLLLNEIVAHTDYTNELTSNDWIELFNPTDAPLALGAGWYLSDDGADLKKWMIPSDTVVPARGWVSFDEQTGFHNPTNLGFGLSKDGEQVFLSYLPGTAEDRIVDAVSFKAQENDWSLGRSPDGGPFWHALTPRTRDTTNAAPPLRVVLSELMYHPPDVGGTNDNALDEFIELFNSTPETVPLFNTNGGWRLDGGVSFAFPADRVLGAGEYLLVVNFDPATNAAQVAAFRSLYGISNAALPIFGPYGGKLANNTDRVALERPQATGNPLDPRAWVIVDEVIYADQSPWACGTDGTGNSLQRITDLGHGCDPANWTGEAPTPGAPRTYTGAGLPTIIVQPQGRVVPTNGIASFSVAVCGVPPFAYQWQRDGTNLEGATNATLVLYGVQVGQAGAYRVAVSNAGGSILSEPATLIVQFPPVITVQPVSLVVTAYVDVNFGVVAGGTPPLQFQWRFSGANLVGATNATLSLTNVQKSQEGPYSVQVQNTAGTVLSSNAQLTVRVPATITQQPTNRYIGGGSNATFTVQAIGTGLLRYQWRHDGTNVVRANASGATTASLLLTNAQLSDNGFYDVVVTDDIRSVVSQAAQLGVLARPVIIRQPQGQVRLEGENVSFSVEAAGMVPMNFRWRRQGATLTNYPGVIVSGLTNSTLTLTNLQLTNAGGYTVVVTNLAGQAPTSSNAPLTVLADFDRDGMADAWEVAYGFQTNLAADASLDLDGDTMSNRAEYVAGTDPTDALSYLKVEAIAADLGNHAVRLAFLAASNRTYTVQCRDLPAAGTWMRVADAPAATTNRVVEIVDAPPAGAPGRYYRLVTPAVP